MQKKTLDKNTKYIWVSKVSPKLSQDSNFNEEGRGAENTKWEFWKQVGKVYCTLYDVDLYAQQGVDLGEGGSLS